VPKSARHEWTVVHRIEIGSKHEIHANEHSNLSDYRATIARLTDEIRLGVDSMYPRDDLLLLV
jgi:hypothetical protein